jgi:hypothetical protein
MTYLSLGTTCSPYYGIPHLVTPLRRTTPCHAVSGMRAGAVNRGTTSWQDLPSELGEIILAQVPLLRLAQLAALAKDFRTAFDQRLAARLELATAPWLRDVSPGPMPADSRDVLSAESYLRAHRTWGCELLYATETEQPRPYYGVFLRPYMLFGWGWPLRYPVPPASWRGSSGRVTCVGRLFVPPSRGPHVPRSAAPFPLHHRSFRMSGWFKCRLEQRSPPTMFRGDEDWVVVSLEVRSEVLVGQHHRTMSCKDLVFRCRYGGSLSHAMQHSSERTGLTLCLTLCIAVATRVPPFLWDVARGAPCDEGGVSRIEPVQRVTLVLPKDSPWPNGAGEAAIVEALTTMLAIVGGRPSGARVAIAEGLCDVDCPYAVTPWRLPCTIGGN